MKNICGMSAEQLTAFAAAAAIELAQGRNNDEICTIKNLFSMISQNLSVIVSQRQLSDKSKNKN